LSQKENVKEKTHGVHKVWVTIEGRREKRERESRGSKAEGQWRRRQKRRWRKREKEREAGTVEREWEKESHRVRQVDAMCAVYVFLAHEQAECRRHSSNTAREWRRKWMTSVMRTTHR
jgi:hypothetical protein